jgi:hypothetical protein
VRSEPLMAKAQRALAAATRAAQTGDTETPPGHCSTGAVRRGRKPIMV